MKLSGILPKTWSLRTKFTLIAVVFGFISFLLVAMLSHRFITNESEEHHKEKALLIWNHILFDLEQAMRHRTHGTIPEAIDFFRRMEGIREIRVFDWGGNEAFSRAGGKADPKVKEALQESKIVSYRQGTGENEVASYVIPIRSKPDCRGCHQKGGGDLIGGVLLSFSLKEMKGDVARENLWFSILFAFIAAGTISGTMIAVKRLFLTPLRRVQDGTEAIATGELSHRVPVISADEIGTLAEHFNRMAQALSEKNEVLWEQFRLVSRSQREWQESFDSVTDPIAVLDKDFNILRANRAYQEFFSYSPHEVHQQKCHDICTYRLGQKCFEEMGPRDKDSISPVIKEIEDKKAGRILQVSLFPSCSPDGEIRGFVCIAKNITAQKEAERNLRVSEMRYRAIVSDQTEMICRFLPDGTLTFVNDAYSSFFGKKAEDLIRSGFNVFFSPEGRTWFQSQFSSFSGERPLVTYEHKVMLPDGIAGWHEWTDRAIFDDEGKIVEFQSVGRDITERKRAEETARIYGEIANSVQIGLNVYRIEDIDGKRVLTLVASNPAAEALTGFRREDVLGKTLSEVASSIPKTELPEVLKEVWLSGKARSLEIPFGDSGTAGKIFSVKAFPLPNSMVGVAFEEITEHRRMDEALKGSEAKFRKLSQEFNTLLDAMPDSLALLSPDLRVLWTNRAAALRSGLEVSDLIGKYCHKLWYNSSEPCKECQAKRSFLTGEVEGDQISSGDGKIWDVRAFPIRDEAGKVINVIEVATDITEKLTLQAEAIRAGHLASLGELAAGVAHEINNPINGIINYAQILVNKMGKEGKDRDIANRIIKEGDRIATIVRNLLSFSRDRGEERGLVQIGDILSESLALTEVQIAKEGIDVKVDIPSDLPSVVAHSQQMQQVFLNILHNARYALNQKYPSRDPGKILRIRCQRMNLEGKTHVRVTFHDQGIGIPSELLHKVMNPFFTTKPTGKGTGLGLSISHGIVTDHGGRLSIASVEGAFTETTVDLPAAAEK
jgi:two-component system, NtrC family, sensor kinase